MNKAILFLTFIFVFSSNYVFSQEKYIKVVLCNQMKGNKDNNIYRLSFIYNNDTLYFPKIKKNTYLNPVSFYEIDTNETKELTVIYENKKHMYDLELESKFLGSKSFILCMFPSKNKKNMTNYHVQNEKSEKTNLMIAYKKLNNW